MATVEFRSVKKSFGDNLILPDFSLRAESGEFLALLGPSGCGKSTLLRILAGLEEPDQGSIHIDGRDVTDLEPKARGVGMVFQSYALYPHMSVAQNLSFPLRMLNLDEAEIKARIDEVAGILDLRSLLDRKPAQLSGGQKQRVAMGRALVRRPRVLLFDEPLSNLDAQLRIKIRAEIAMLHKRIKSTVIYVTHDQSEAMTLADRVAVLNKGTLEQCDGPMAIYRNPRTRFVGSFIGTPAMNVLAATEIESGILPKSASFLGVRPEDAKLASSSEAADERLATGEIRLIERLGHSTHLHVQLKTETFVVEVRGGSDLAHRLGDRVAIKADRGSLFYFNESGVRFEESRS